MTGEAVCPVIPFEITNWPEWNPAFGVGSPWKVAPFSFSCETFLLNSLFSSSSSSRQILQNRVLKLSNEGRLWKGERFRNAMELPWKQREHLKIQATTGFVLDANLSCSVSLGLVVVEEAYEICCYWYWYELPRDSNILSLTPLPLSPFHVCHSSSKSNIKVHSIRDLCSSRPTWVCHRKANRWR